MHYYMQVLSCSKVTKKSDKYQRQIIIFLGSFRDLKNIETNNAQTLFITLLHLYIIT